MKFKKLADIANIHSGLVLSRKEAGVGVESTYKYKQLNLRSVSEDGQINIEILDDFFSNDSIKETFITRENDIVLRLFAPIRPVFISANYTGLIVPSQFVILRVKKHEILPEFLYMHLSRKDTINDIYAKEGGYTMRNVRISTLSDLSIPILSIKKQSEIVSIYEVHNKRKELYNDLLHQYDTHTNAVIKRLIEGDA